MLDERTNCDGGAARSAGRIFLSERVGEQRVGEERVSRGVQRGGDGQKRVEGLSQLRENETLHSGRGEERKRGRWERKKNLGESKRGDAADEDRRGDSFSS